MHTPKVSDPHEHSWLKWVGLQAPPEDPEGWVPVATGMDVSDPQTGHSNDATRLLDILKQAGIDGRQRTYVVPDKLQMDMYLGVLTGNPGPDAADRIRVAVLVHERDLEQAKALPEVIQELNRDRQLPDPITDEELTRQSLEAGDQLKARISTE